MAKILVSLSSIDEYDAFDASVTKSANRIQELKAALKKQKLPVLEETPISHEADGEIVLYKKGKQVVSIVFDKDANFYVHLFDGRHIDMVGHTSSVARIVSTAKKEIAKLS